MMPVSLEKLEKARLLAIQLKALREEEMELRREIATELAEEHDLHPGTHRLSQDGLKITLKMGLNYSLDQDELIELMDNNLLTDEEENCIRTKYDLKLREYKTASNVETLNDVIIVKPSAPVLTIELGE